MATKTKKSFALAKLLNKQTIISLHGCKMLLLKLYLWRKKNN